MGLMDPEELCTEVESTADGSQTDPVIKITEIKNVTNDCVVPAASSEESIIALNVVNDILDESIEIFNKVDEINLLNNNGLSESSDSKTEVDSKLSCSSHLVSLDYKLDEYLIQSVEGGLEKDEGKASCKTDYISNDHDSVGSNFVSINDNLKEANMADIDYSTLNKNTTDLLDCKIDNNITELIKCSSTNSSSTTSPVETDSSRSNTPENILKEDGIILENELHKVYEDNTNYNTEENDFKWMNGVDTDIPLSFTNNEHLYSEPATIQVSESSERHNCFNNPEVVKLKENYERVKNVMQVYQEKSDRLDDCLADLDKMFDKVSLLEKKICQHEMELDISKQEKEKETKAFNTYKQETTAKIESLKKQYDQANKEKEGMTMRYAKSEKELLDMKKEKQTLLKQIKDQQKENENILSKLKHLSEDKSRLAVSLDNKNMELSTAFKDMDKLKEDINSRDIKIKWIQNKLLAEMDLHKECPEQIESLNKQISELEKKLEKNQEDIEHYKKSIQELEAIKVLENQVREEQAKLIMEKHDQSERVIKLKALQIKTDSLIEENNNLSYQVQNLEVERLDLEKRLSESRQESQERANHLADLKSKLVEFDSISNQLCQERERLEKANEEVERLRKANEELMQDMSTCRSRESEMLSFTQKLTTKNVQLQSEFSNIESRAGELMLEAEKAESTSDTLRKEVEQLKDLLDVERSKREEERNLLAREVAEGRAKISNLESQLNETKSNLHTSNNKHQALIRELQRELQTCHRRLEQEGKTQSSSSQGDGSRHVSSSGPSGKSSASSSLTSSCNSIPDATVVQPSHLQLEVSPAILVERILKLQTDSKNYQDKIEFLEDHNTTLVEEIKKKNRLLHSYILREQAGALASQASDKHKMEVSKHGGIMSSVYGSKATDEGMTLELSLQINHKLQAILEDTLLKNITLKENIDTLGDEIARLKRTHPS